MCVAVASAVCFASAAAVGICVFSPFEILDESSMGQGVNTAL